MIMSEGNKSIKSNQEPLLALNEFEEAAGAILDLTKDQTLLMLQEANQKKDTIIQEAKQSFSILEKAYLEKTDAEIKLEKEKLFSEFNGKLKFIANISEEKIKETVGYILEKIIPF